MPSISQFNLSLFITWLSVETQYDSVVNERRGMSGVAVAALVVAGIAAAAVITMLIINSQQRNSDEALAQERARTGAVQQTPAQPAQQQPIFPHLSRLRRQYWYLGLRSLRQLRQNAQASMLKRT
jgi:hypothetical protein